MVNIILFEKALKLSWNPKPLSNTDTLNHISSMGPEWCITLLKNVTLSTTPYLQHGLNLVVSNN